MFEYALVVAVLHYWLPYCIVVSALKILVINSTRLGERAPSSLSQQHNYKYCTGFLTRINTLKVLKWFIIKCSAITTSEKQ